ncbi:MAG: hypothetical protein AAGA93_26805 [Actinomycetota bacterium]
MPDPERDRRRSPERRARCGSERGSAIPLTAVALGVAALALTLLVISAEVRVRQARLQWAADAAALAAAAEVVAGPVDGGPGAVAAATDAAEANGARLVSIASIAVPEADAAGSTVPGMGTTAGFGASTAISPTVVVVVASGRLRASAGAARHAVATS